MQSRAWNERGVGGSWLDWAGAQRDSLYQKEMTRSGSCGREKIPHKLLQKKDSPRPRTWTSGLGRENHPWKQRKGIQNSRSYRERASCHRIQERRPLIPRRLEIQDGGVDTHRLAPPSTTQITPKL